MMLPAASKTIRRESAWGELSLLVLMLLLHFSIAVSRLADQSKVLAQRVALLEERQRRLEAGTPRHEAADADLVAVDDQ